MKTIKKMLGLAFLLAVLLTCLLTTASASEIVGTGNCGDDGTGWPGGPSVTWALDNTGQITFSGSGSVYGYPSDDIPWCNAVGSDDFITSIVIEDGVSGVYPNYGFDNVTEIYFDGDASSADEALGTGNASVTLYYIPGTTGWTDSEAYDAEAGTWNGYTLKVWEEKANILAFGYCGGEGDGTNLTWELADNGTLTISGSGAMADYVGQYEGIYTPWYGQRDFITAAVIDDHVTNIGEFAFYNCDSLLSVDIGNGVSTIGGEAFWGCENLVTVIFGSNTRTIEDNAFKQCYNLACVTIPDNVIAIGNYAFQYCNKLATVTIGSGVTSVGTEAFLYTSLTSVHFKGNAPTVTSADMYWYDGSNSFPPLTTVYYIPGTTGWTDSEVYDAEAGTWNGYKLAVWEERAMSTSVEKTSMVLGNDLSIMFAFTADGITGTGNYATITKTFADGTADRVERVEQADWNTAVIDGTNYYTISYNGVAAKEMSDEVKVQVFNADGEAISAVFTDTIWDYAMRMIEQDMNASMFVDMLIYGAEAQKQFGYGGDALATSELTAEQLAKATQSVSYTNKLIAGEGYRASSLMLENNIQLVLLFGGIDQTMTATVSYTDHYGYAKTFTVSGSAFEPVNYGGEACYSITIDALVMADGRQPVTVTVKNADGNEVASATDSVESYIARMSSTGTLYEAIMKFSDSAAASLKNWQ